ncbi:hypothetical protein [Massilia sp. DD77]|uniref:hypothetical protein n=1 Tax=Massilia sp. DD77 TaxID=3109349 RepID=UPI00300082DE
MPTIRYRIVNTDPEEHQITVRFFSDVLPESALVSSYKADGKTPDRYRTDWAITLPVPAPEGDELHALIMSYCPVDWFNTMHAVKNPDIPTPLPILAIGAVRDAIMPEREPTAAEIEAAYLVAVQGHMDTVARSYGYDHLLSATSYADEPAVEKYQQEGMAFRAWRSKVWAYCLQVQADVNAGVRVAPAYDALFAELPALELEPPAILAAT